VRPASHGSERATAERAVRCLRQPFRRGSGGPQGAARFPVVMSGSPSPAGEAGLTSSFGHRQACATAEGGVATPAIRRVEALSPAAKTNNSRRRTMYRNFLVKKDERALLFRNGDFVRILGPGEHGFFDPLFRLSVEVFPLANTRFEHRLAEYLAKAEPEMVAEHFHAIALGATEVALRHENGVAVELLAPNARRLYWKGFIDLRHEVMDIGESFEVPKALVAVLVRGPQRIAGVEGVFPVQVPEHHVGVLFVDGRLDRLLEPGLHAFFRFNRELRAEIVDRRLQAIEVSGQEILTRDKVALRVNLTAGYRITDVQLAYAQQAKPVDYLYKELQFGLRAAVGTRSLDELLENKGVLDEGVAAHIRRAVEGYGLSVQSVGVKDIILPGEMKAILARVVEAEKVAQANVIRRREETSATRSLLNTAKVMEDNPVALRLKELETLEKVTEKIDKISVFGGLEGVLQNLVKIRP
jgi:regulator of protease activity HflC (stomatin/prohibitin superfamily)